jgi:hypothetical protein
MKHTPYIASITTPPAIILNIYGIIAENINVLLLIGVSIVSIVFWCLAIKTKRNENAKHIAETAAHRAKEAYYKQCTRNDCGLKNTGHER